MVSINILDKKLFGNQAGEDEDKEFLSQYFVNHNDFSDFFCREQKLCVVSARKGMGKSALIAKLHYDLAGTENDLIINVTGNDLLGLGSFESSDHAYLENYWKLVICRKIILELSSKISFASSDRDISIIEQAELEGFKKMNLLGCLAKRFSKLLEKAGLDTDKIGVKNPDIFLNKYLQEEEYTIWLLVDDIDAKYINNEQYQARVGAFFSAVRHMTNDYKGLKVRATVRSDVWACLRGLEDLDKIEQYIVSIFWNRKFMLDILAKRISCYVVSNFPDSAESKFKPEKDYNKILDIIFDSPIEWVGNKEARLFDAISAFSNRRPRWMIQLCTMAAKKVRDISLRTKKIKLEHINYILEDFGKNRRDDLVKEHKHQFSEIEFLIDSIRSSKKEMKYSEINNMLDDNYIKGRAFDQLPMLNGQKPTGHEDFGNFLYLLGIFSRKHDDGRTFTHYTDDLDLYKSSANKNDSIVWSIHPTYRSFLNIH
ncbi:MAG: hypothetical protein RBR22_08295 [Desulfuromonas sp.]|nr:hypothetical protein [Desulfuromonas sp.]